MGDSELRSGHGQPSRVFRVHWVPGTDHLLGTCHCGAQHTAADPVELWSWLHGHPIGHRAAADTVGSTEAPSHPRTLVVA